MRKVLSVFIWIAGIAAVSLLAVQAKDAEIGSPAPDFKLEDLSGKSVSLSDYKDKYVVLEWTNPECPFVKKHYGTENMQKLQQTWTDKDVVWLTIVSSAKGKQGYFSEREWKKIVEKNGSAHSALLRDPDGMVGKTYGAKTTPHMFVVNPQGLLVYKGAIDDKRSADPEDVEGSLNFVDMALTQSLAGERVKYPSTKSYGCSVKYK